MLLLEPVVERYLYQGMDPKQSLDEAAAERSRERWLRQQSAEQARLTGIALDLAEQGATATVAYDHLLETGFLKPEDRVVLFNTGAGLKYTDVTAEAVGLRRLS